MRLWIILSPICMRSLMTIGCEMTKFYYFENLLTTTTTTIYTCFWTRISGLGYGSPMNVAVVLIDSKNNNVHWGPVSGSSNRCGLHCAGNNRYYDDKGPRRFVPGPFCYYDYEELLTSIRLMQYSLHLTPVSNYLAQTSLCHSLSSFRLYGFWWPMHDGPPVARSIPSVCPSVPAA